MQNRKALNHGEEFMASPYEQLVRVISEAGGSTGNQPLSKEIKIMRRRFNPVQTFIRNFVRLVVFVPLWLLIALGDFQGIWSGAGDAFASGMAWGIGKTIAIFWVANILAGIFYVLPEWERIVLLRLGKSVGVRGPGMFIIPPFLYSVARTIDIRITTYEVKATRTLTKDNIPVDVVAAVELEVEDPETAAIAVKDYWKTTEWASMEGLKSTIGANNLKPLSPLRIP